MRATINFEVNLDEVEDIMTLLVRREADELNYRAQDLEDVFRDHNKEGGLQADELLTHTVEVLAGVTNQLQQYRDMLLSFERAKSETILPQCGSAPLVVDAAIASPVGSAPDPQSLGDLVRNMKEMQKALISKDGFDTFLQRMQDEEQEDSENDKKSS